MQVDPIKPILKAPGTKHLKLEYDHLLSSFAFNFNLCRYTLEQCLSLAHLHALYAGLLIFPARLSCDWSFACVPMVGQCRLTL